VIDILKKLLPSQVQKILPQIEELLKNEVLVSDLIIALEEIEKEIDIASKKPATDKKLRNAFNDAASVVSVGKNYLKNGSISMFSVAKLASGNGRIKDNVQLLVEAFNAKQPSTLCFTQSLKDNAVFSGAFKRLVLKTNGNLFRLETGENGECHAIELLTGQSMRVHLEKADYEEIQKALETGKAPPAPPKGPEV